jgi:deoxyribonuclease V
MTWPTTPDALMAWQDELAREAAARFEPSYGGAARSEPSDRSAARSEPSDRGATQFELGVVGGCFVCFPRGETGPGRAGDPAWAAAAIPGSAPAVVEGEAGAPYVPGLLALREGPLLEAAVRALGTRPDVLLVDATGRDHPRRAGLATALGAVLDLPTVGVTHRPLLAAGTWPEERRGAAAALRIGDETVGCWLRVRARVRPLAVHPAWRTDLDAAIAVVLESTSRARTPEPLRAARTAARRARAQRP